MKKRNVVRVILTLLVFSLLLTGCGGGGAGDGASFKAGEYEGEAPGYGGPIKVKVTFSDSAIESVEVLSHTETDEIGTNAIDTIPGAIVESQSLGVDGVSGATRTSQGIIAAVADAVKQAGGDVKALTEKKAVVKEEAKEALERETDVVVVGGGGAGLAAAVSAAGNGAKVVLVEKTAGLGGNTVRAGGPYNAVDPARQANVPPADEASMEKVKALTEKEAKSDRHAALQEELKEELASYDGSKLFDSKALHKLQTYDGGDYAGKLELIEKLVEESLPTSEWMHENGVNWKEEITTVPGGLWPRAHLPENAAGGDYIKASENKAKELGVEILLNAPAEELLIEDGKIAGIKGTCDGAPMTIKAKAVIMATGGFAANKEMRKEYVPELNDSLPTTNAPSIEGDGIKMAEEVNANTIGMEFIQSLPLGNPEDGSLNGWMGGSGVEYYYQINKEGVRFMAEDGRRDTMTAALLAQPDSMSYVITCANNELEVNDKNENIWGDDVDKLVEEGKIFRADTIEDLAKQIDVDPEVLKKTNDTFNSYVAAGKDEEFGRTLFGKPIDKAPYFASPRVPTVHHTMGGLEINKSCEVLDKEGNVIPGFFAAGEVTGGIHGKNRLGGNALVDIHVFGKTAGESAAAFVK